MTSFFSIKTLAKILGNDTVWVNTKDNKVPIIDGKVSFIDETTGAKFELYVTQIKGKGTADADDLVNLSDQHKFILKTLLQRFGYQQYWTTDEILGKIYFDLRQQTDDGSHLNFKPNNWRRPISELYRRKVLLQPTRSSPPRYTLDLARAEECLNSGKF